MTLHVSCPECKTKYDFPASFAGRKVRCKSCAFIFPVAAAAVDVVEVEPEPKPKPLPPRTAAIQTPPAPRRPSRDDDDEDDDDRPARRRSRPRPPARRWGLLFACLFVPFLLLLGLAGGAAVWWKDRNAPTVPTSFAQTSSTEVKKQEPFNISEARQSVVHIKCLIPGFSEAVGTGFLISDDGLIYTNRHVIVPALALRGAKLLVGVPARDNPDKLDYFPAAVVKVAPPRDSLDFAILKITARPEYGRFPVLPLHDGPPLALGAPVAVVGYPVTIDDAPPTLSFNKGSISATSVPFEKHTYYQTDAAVNPGNSGGPMLNEKGSVVGIVTLKKANANNMGYALHLSEFQQHAQLDPARVEQIKPEPGPLDLQQMQKSTGKPLPASSWDVRKGVLRHERALMSLDNRGQPYWMTTKEPVPENFQITMQCLVTLPPNEVRIQPSQRSIVRSMCVRFSTADHEEEILKPAGYLFLFTPNVLRLTREDQEIQVARSGSPEGDSFYLTITRDKGEITFEVDGELLLRYTDPQPIKGRSYLSLGGYLSRLYVTGITLMPLDDGTGPLVQSHTKPTPTDPPRPDGPAVVPLSSPASDLTLGGNGKYLIGTLPKAKKLAIFDAAEGKVVKELPLLDETARTAAGRDKLVVFYPTLRKIERWNLRTFEREATVDQPFKGSVKRACMGVASHGPILVFGDGDFPLGNGALLDLETFKPLPVQAKATFPFDYALANASGDVFTCYAYRGSEGCANLIVHGNEAQFHRLPRGPGYLIGSADGQFFYSHRYDTPDGRMSTGGAQFTPELKLRTGPNPSGADGRPGTVALRPFYFDLQLSKSSCKLSFFTCDHDKPFGESMTLALGETEWQNDQIPWHTRLSVLPDAKKIVILPHTNDRLLVYNFDVDATLKKSAIDYLYVASEPPRSATIGEVYSYPVEVTSKQEGVRFSLLSGPKGMTIAADEGTVTWKVPAEQTPGAVTFVVQVKDRSGLTATHTCRIVVAK